MTNAPATLNIVVDAAKEVKPILAERYKTKSCRNFELTGVCPYEIRCMFAHGEAEMRTKEMNLIDGLVTEEAIKAFRLKTSVHRTKSAKKRSTRKTNEPAVVRVRSPVESASPVSSLGISISSPSTQSVTMSALPTPDDSLSSLPDTRTPVRTVRMYRHDPYSWYMQAVDCGTVSIDGVEPHVIVSRRVLPAVVRVA